MKGVGNVVMMTADPVCMLLYVTLQDSVNL